MQTPSEPHPAAHRRPAALDLIAAGLLLATVVLHVVAMIPAYFVGTGTNSSLVSQPDQAALYSVLAASWALALVIGLTGPHRTPVAAALAVGLALGELGFRVADLGDALRYGASTAGAGLWLMEAAWVVGAAAAAVAVLAARHRHGAAVLGPAAVPAPVAPATPAPASEWQIDWSAPVGASGGEQQPVEADEPAPALGTAAPQPPGGGAEDPTTSVAVPAGSTDATTSLPLGDPTSVWDPAAIAGRNGDIPAAPTVSPDPEDAHERAAWTMLVVVLALLVAGAFLPAWDHAVAYSTVTGQGLTRSLGNAFSGPWQQVIGTVLAALAMAAVPIAAVRLRNRVVGAAAVCGVLLILASQLAAAVVQVDQPLSPSEVGLSAGQASQLGLQLALKLTGWFTVDALAAYALFAAVLVWATLRIHHENSPGTPPNAPEVRRDAIPWAS